MERKELQRLIDERPAVTICLFPSRYRGIHERGLGGKAPVPAPYVTFIRWGGLE